MMNLLSMCMPIGWPKMRIMRPMGPTISEWYIKLLFKLKNLNLVRGSSIIWFITFGGQSIRKEQPIKKATTPTNSFLSTCTMCHWHSNKPSIRRWKIIGEVNPKKWRSWFDRRVGRTTWTLSRTEWRKFHISNKFDWLSRDFGGCNILA